MKKKTRPSKKPAQAKPVRSPVVEAPAKAAEPVKKTEKPKGKTRGRAKKSTPKAQRPQRKKRAVKKPKERKAAGVNAELLKKRLAAGKKAAATRRANTARRGPGRPPKEVSLAKRQSSQEQEFMMTALHVGIDRSEALLRKIRDVSQGV
jgi:hypothetical protein